MKKLNIFKYIPNNLNKNGYNLIWCLNHQDKYSNKLLSIFNLKKKNIIDLKKRINIDLKNFFFIKIDKKNILNFFKIKNDFSACVLSNLVEKNPYGNNFFQEFLKIRLTQKFIKQNKISKINIDKENIFFKKNLEQFLNLGLQHNRYNKKYYLIIYNFFKNFLFFLKSAILNINLANNLNTIKNQKPVFFSFFSYTDKKKALRGIYESQYWKGLKKKNNYNWVHLFSYSSSYKNTKEVSQCVKNLNKKTKENNHFFMNDYLSLGVIIKSSIKILKIFFLVLLFNYRLNKLNNKKINEDNILFHYLLDELVSLSLFRNILLFYTFEKFFKLNKINSKVIYCLENQPWEKILLYFLNRKKINDKKFDFKTYGVIHSSVRYWDLRFMNLLYDKVKFNGYFNPDYVISNGEFVSKILKSNGFAKRKIITAESLRYFDLLYEKKFKIEKNKKVKRILILSDYNETSNIFFEKLIKSYKNDKNTFIYLKCHLLKPLKILQKNLKIINHLSEIKKNINNVIVSDMTAAAIDIYYKGIIPYVYVKKDNFDFSPLYKFINYPTFSSIENLKEKINIQTNESSNVISKSNFKNYFKLNKKYNVWKQILQN